MFFSPYLDIHMISHIDIHIVIQIYLDIHICLMVFLSWSLVMFHDFWPEDHSRCAGIRLFRGIEAATEAQSWGRWQSVRFPRSKWRRKHHILIHWYIMNIGKLEFMFYSICIWHVQWHSMFIKFINICFIYIANIQGWKWWSSINIQYVQWCHQ